MKDLISIIIAAALTLLTVNYLVFAFTEPAGPPPGNNVAAPVNVGPGRQIKQGDLTVGNLSAASITLGGDTRFSWPFGGGGGGGAAACNWRGLKCQCAEDITGAGEGFIILGTVCENRLVEDVKIVDFEIGAEKSGGIFGGGKGENKGCPPKPPACRIYEVIRTEG